MCLSFILRGYCCDTEGHCEGNGGKSQACVLGVNHRVLSAAALPAKLAKPGVSVREWVPAAPGAIPSAPFCTGSWVLILGTQFIALTLCGCKGREGWLIAATPARASPSLSTPKHTLLFFLLVKPNGWQVLRKTEPDVSRECAAALPLQSCKSRVEKHPSTAMQPPDI